jgi:hypothetical protein
VKPSPDRADILFVFFSKNKKIKAKAGQNGYWNENWVLLIKKIGEKWGFVPSLNN